MKILASIAVCALRTAYFFFKLFLNPREKITFLSRQNDKPSLDFLLLQNALKENGFKGDIVTLCKKIPASLLGKICYGFHIFSQMYHIATAKMVVVDGYSIAVSVLKHKPSVKVIQIWHALGAVKKFGYQSVGTEAGSAQEITEIMCMHKNYDFVLAPSIATAKHFKEAFRVDDSKIKLLGMPRIDYILNSWEKADKIHEKYPQTKTKQNILYIPTFRRDEALEIEDLIEKIDTSRYNLVVKLHSEDYKTKQILKDGVIYDGNFGVYDWANVANKIITDYSSLAIEFSLLNIPIYFYVYDIEQYKNSPGLNLDFEKEEIGRYKAVTVCELLEMIEHDYDLDVLKRFKERYISVNTKDCSEQLAKFIIKEMS